jgi:hypothetical protein
MANAPDAPSSAFRTERRIVFPVDMEKSEVRIRGFRHRNREKTP